MSDRRLLERAGLLQGLSDLDRDETLNALRSYELGPNEQILEEGENDRSLIVVVEGTLVATVSNCVVGRIEPGETVGEMAMFGSLDRRSASVRTESSARVLVLDEEGLRFMRMRDNPVVQRLEAQALRTVAKRLREADLRIGKLAEGEIVREFSGQGMLAKLASLFGMSGALPSGDPPKPAQVLRNTPGFGVRDDVLLEKLAERFTIMAARQGEAIVEEGSFGDEAFIVADGRVAVYRSVDEERVERIAQLGPGHVVGAVALADPGGRSATVRTIQPTWLLRIDLATYKELEADPGPEGRAFRRGFIDALSAQLRLANEHIVRLSGRWGKN